MVRALILLLACMTWAGAAEPPLRVGLSPDSPPFVVSRDGQPAGFSVDLYRAIAARLRRDVRFIVAPPPALVEALEGKTIDVLAGPLPATPERAADLLFGEGFVWMQYQFGVRPGATLAALDALKGKRLAVPEDTDYAEWAAREGARLGFTAQTFPSPAATFVALRQGHADATLTDDVSLAAAVAEGGVAPALALPETRAEGASAFRMADPELRDAIEDAVTCLKRSGEVADLAHPWLGHTAGPDELERVVEPGYGIAGLAGYDPKSRKTSC